jgi:hypothetical protein
MIFRRPFSCGDAFFVFGSSVGLAVEIELAILTGSRIRIGGAELWGNPDGLPASGRSRDNRIVTADGPHFADQCVNVRSMEMVAFVMSRSRVWRYFLARVFGTRILANAVSGACGDKIRLFTFEVCSLTPSTPRTTIRSYFDKQWRLQ